MELLQAFGIDVRLLIANLINFLLLVGILYKLGYQPILKFVRERQAKIEQGIKDAERASQKLSDAAKEKESLLTEAHQEAQEILSRAKDQAGVQAKAILEKTNNEAREIVQRAKREIRLEQEQSVATIKQETASLVLAVSEKLLREKLDEKGNKQFIEKAIKDMTR